MKTHTRRFDGFTLSSTFRAWGTALTMWLLMLGCLTWTSAEAQTLYVNQVVPSQVTVGQVFTIHGQFQGMTSAAAYLSDGVFGLPLTILSVSNQQISARIDSTPWPMTGTLHIMSQENVLPISTQIWQGPGSTIGVTGGSQFDLTQVATGGVLTVVGSAPVDPPQIFVAGEADLTLDPEEPCDWVTALILIEPDLGFPSDPTLPPGPSNFCNGIGLNVAMTWTQGTNTTGSDFYSTMAAGLNQFLNTAGVNVSHDPNGGSQGNGSLLIEQVNNCPTLSGAAVLLCD